MTGPMMRFPLVPLPVDKVGRAAIAAKLAAFLAGVQLPAFEDDVKLGMAALSHDVFSDYGPDGVAELHRLARERRDATR